MNKDFLDKLRDLLINNIPAEMRQEAVEKFKTSLEDPVLQLAAVIQTTATMRQQPIDNFPVTVLAAAWSANTLLRTCPIPEMRIVMRDFLIDAIMKGDSEQIIFPGIDK